VTVVALAVKKSIKVPASVVLEDAAVVVVPAKHNIKNLLLIFSGRFLFSILSQIWYNYYILNIS